MFYKGVFLFIAIFIAALLAYTALNRTLCEASIGQGGVQVAAKFAYEAKKSR
ncbi:TPA: Hok/Gef family protein [Klebsiella variicola]|nr:Hok/Gef family protein [Klebsiella variicola]HBW0863571.1 Hok/Gef family protein [Klebsiella variicola]HBW0868519.1 Hok/Gef family protein [Klebsiella variicola]